MPRIQEEKMSAPFSNNNNHHGLPMELVILVFSFLAPTALSPKAIRHKDRGRWLRASTRDVWALCQCSKWLYSIGLPFLYQFVSLQRSSMRLFLRTLTSIPERGQMVRQIFISLETASLMPNLETLTLRSSEDSVGMMGPEVGPLNSLLLGILEGTPHLELLDMALHSKFQFAGAIPALPKLTEIRLGCSEIYTYRLTAEQWEWIASAAPNLTTLEAFGRITCDRDLDLGSITKMKMEHDCRATAMDCDLLQQASRLKSVFCYTGHRCVHGDRAGERAPIIRNLMPSHETLEYLHLECKPFSLRNDSKFTPIHSLKSFAKLQHLLISTTFFVTSWSAAPLLDNLPASLRSLSVLCYHSSVNSHILALVESRSWRHSNFESLEIQLVTAAMKGAKTLPLIEEACRRNNIRYSCITNCPILSLRYSS